jgi:hypothetical protein
MLSNYDETEVVYTTTQSAALLNPKKLLIEKVFHAAAIHV